MDKNNKKVLYIFVLNIAILIFSIAGIFSKNAGLNDFLSFKFCLYYGISIFLLFLYAIFWQQVIKVLPLTLAYVNKAITILWGLIFSKIIFDEKITIGKMVGALIVIIGIIIFVIGDSKKDSIEHE